MSREIKFRAWIASQQKMLQWGSGVISINHHQGIESVPAPTYYRAEDVALMQYTGLRDANGKEIYEGDIIWRPNVGIPLLVRWNEQDARFDLTREPENMNANFIWFRDSYEIIGNIYEHPHLLEQCGIALND